MSEKGHDAVMDDIVMARGLKSMGQHLQFG